MTLVQKTLEGETTDEPRVRPDTFKWCQDCTDYVLRSDWLAHREHHEEAVEEFQEEQAENDGGTDEEETVEKAGHWYDITLSFSVDYRFRVPAWSDHQAEEVAEEWAWDASPTDQMLVHTETDERDVIWEDDEALPEDYDPFGSERVYEAIERAKEDGGESSNAD